MPYFFVIGGKTMNPWVSISIPIISGVIIGIISFFMKRSVFLQIDELKQIVKEVKDKSVARHDYDFAICECRDDIKKIRQDYTPRSVHTKDIDECKGDIKRITEDYITKEDFFREQAKTDRKLDRIMDILLEMKGGEKRG
ncbi:MAG: hypothetical protein LBS36_06710 [Oscillospiraceae bacterium]|nr:hypothetical protein [Oscillospiraceae bacterium]